MSHASPGTRKRLPSWLKRNIPSGSVNAGTSRLLDELHLETVCEHAKCPNRMECFARRTATFLILGSRCTRNCAFCGIETSIGGPPPDPVDPTEPQRIAEALSRLGLGHVVLTCVSRDDLPDGGAGHFCDCIAAIRSLENPPTVEVLPSDFAGNMDAVDRLADALPEVYNYNTETVPRLFRAVRGPIPDINVTLDIFRRIARRRPAILLKSGLMLGLGETNEEVLDVMRRLRDAGCRRLTLGQYLRPTPEKMPVARYVTPEEFDAFAVAGRELGFDHVFAGPFVRSSYQAESALKTC